MKSFLVPLLLLAACGGNMSPQSTPATCILVPEQMKAITEAITVAGTTQKQAIADGYAAQATSTDGLTEWVKKLVDELRTTRTAPVIIERRMIYPGDERRP